MESKGGTQIPIPMSMSDVFTFAIPGALLLGGVVGFEIWIRVTLESHPEALAQVHLPVSSALSYLWLAGGANSGAEPLWLVGVALGVAAVVASYVTGHLLSALGAFVIDRWVVYKGSGYPYERLLDLGQHDPLLDASRSWYRGIWFWGNAYVLLRFLEMAGGWPAASIAAQTVGWILLVALILKLLPLERGLAPGDVHWESFSMAQMLKLLTREVSSLRASFAKLGEAQGVKERAVLVRGWAIRVRGALWWLLVVLPDAIHNPYNRIVNHVKPMSDALRASFSQEMQRRFQMAPEVAGSNNFWLPYIFVMERARSVSARLNELRRLHRFSRNLGMAFYSLFLSMAIGLIAESQFTLAVADPGEKAVLIALPLFAFLCARVFLAWHYHLYFATYTRYLLRSFVALSRLLPSDGAQPHLS